MCNDHDKLDTSNTNNDKTATATTTTANQSVCLHGTLVFDDSTRATIRKIHRPFNGGHFINVPMRKFMTCSQLSNDLKIGRFLRMLISFVEWRFAKSTPKTSDAQVDSFRMPARGWGEVWGGAERVLGWAYRQWLHSGAFPRKTGWRGIRWATGACGTGPAGGSAGFPAPPGAQTATETIRRYKENMDTGKGSREEQGGAEKVRTLNGKPGRKGRCKESTDTGKGSREEQGGAEKVRTMERERGEQGGADMLHCLVWIWHILNNRQSFQSNLLRSFLAHDHRSELTVIANQDQLQGQTCRTYFKTTKLPILGTCTKEVATDG